MFTRGRLTHCAGVKDFLQDLNPALLTTIDSEFDKVASEAAPVPTRISADLAAPAPTTGGGAKGKVAAASADPMDDLFPRVDLDKLIPSATVTAINDANWKAKKEALETIQSLLEANKRLKPTLCALLSLLPRCENMKPTAQPSSLRRSRLD